MSNEPTPPRRPIVPGPTNQGLAARAVAMREQKANLEKETRAAPSPMEWEREQQAKRMSLPPPILPFQGVGKLAGAIASVMSEIGTIQKGGYNKFHNYHYARMEDLLHVLTPLMGKHGIAVFQNEIEIKTIETRIAVTYEFSIIHSSGEIWPERPRFTGMSMARDSKGNFDDKAVNKAHTAARKYFLLSLFQVPAGDFDDADPGSSQQPATQPKQSAVVERAAGTEQPVAKQRPRTVPGPATSLQQPITDERLLPQKIGLGKGAGAESWAQAFIDAVEGAETEEELAQWDELNGAVLQKLLEEHRELYQKIDKVMTRRILEIAPLSAMPDAKNDTQEAMNWVAQQLMDAETYEQAEGLWNAAVAPHESEFDPADWELLMNEWRRAEIRLNTDVEPEPPEI
jgi:hypothetical protein